jgi:hypothetical protein
LGFIWAGKAKEKVVAGHVLTCARAAIVREKTGTSLLPFGGTADAVAVGQEWNAGNEASKIKIHGGVC